MMILFKNLLRWCWKINKEEIQINNMFVNLYDTWRLESNDTVTWEKEILEKVKKHDASDEIKDCRSIWKRTRV